MIIFSSLERKSHFIFLKKHPSVAWTRNQFGNKWLDFPGEVAHSEMIKTKLSFGEFPPSRSENDLLLFK